MPPFCPCHDVNAIIEHGVVRLTNVQEPSHCYNERGSNIDFQVIEIILYSHQLWHALQAKFASPPRRVEHGNSLVCSKSSIIPTRRGS